MGDRMTVRAAAIWVGLSALLMVVGAVSPWATVLGTLSVNGTDANAGVTVLVCALIVAAVVALGYFTKLYAWTLVVSILVVFVAASISIYNLVDVERFVSTNSPGLVSIGWGLWVDSIACVSCALALFVLMRASHRVRMATKRGADA
jgi:hypothetical protein